MYTEHHDLVGGKSSPTANK